MRSNAQIRICEQMRASALRMREEARTSMRPNFHVWQRRASPTPRQIQPDDGVGGGAEGEAGEQDCEMD